MSSDDYLLAAVEGLSTGVAHSYLPFAQAKFEDQLTRNRNSQQLKDQLAANVELERQTLPLKMQLEQGKNADTAKRQLDLEQQKDSQLGSDFDPDTQKKLGLDPTKRYRISQVNAALAAKTKIYATDSNASTKEAEQRLKDEFNQKILELKGQANEISAGKTGIFQGLRNSLFGTPGVSVNQGLPINQPQGTPGMTDAQRKKLVELTTKGK